MQTDERCCGTGTCLIDANGRCWCGQEWNGSDMCMPKTTSETHPVSTPDTHLDTTVGSTAPEPGALGPAT